ncbi:hypothetical protein [Wielerella bovis]|uniref:hypothetical protein n=1 Tax=Wielerella bovis TaxID=2917790 RepID=UPI002019E12C|nr:hypothetical protein [Wielerella bovis]MCG7657459.1 hypothetical protein [Wielerella bovis]MCG7659680.1 hypothetical protein [Wielerella bovis]
MMNLINKIILASILSACTFQAAAKDIPSAFHGQWVAEHGSPIDSQTAQTACYALKQNNMAVLQSETSPYLITLTVDKQRLHYVHNGDADTQREIFTQLRFSKKYTPNHIAGTAKYSGLSRHPDPARDFELRLQDGILHSYYWDYHQGTGEMDFWAHDKFVRCS